MTRNLDFKVTELLGQMPSTYKYCVRSLRGICLLAKFFVHLHSTTSLTGDPIEISP